MQLEQAAQRVPRGLSSLARAPVLARAAGLALLALLVLVTRLAVTSEFPPRLLASRPTRPTHAGPLGVLCTNEHVAGLLHDLDALPAVTFVAASINATVKATGRASTEGRYNADVPEHCEVAFAFSHDELGDKVTLTMFFPHPAHYRNRWFTLGGGGWSVSGAGNLASGPAHGAASGSTDGGFGPGGMLTADRLVPFEGVLSLPDLESFGHRATHELTVLGKALASRFYAGTHGGAAPRAYFLGCSEGGREGMTAVQRYPADFDGVLVAAPNFYFPAMQLAQGWPAMAMARAGHWPSPCAMQALVRDAIDACDALDGRVDGVVARSDMCDYDYARSVGRAWDACEIEQVVWSDAPTSGVISQQDADVARAIYGGMVDDGDEGDGGGGGGGGGVLWFPLQPGTGLVAAAAAAWDGERWGPGQHYYFNTYYQNLVLKSRDSPALDYANFTLADTYALMRAGAQAYGDVLGASWPDLSAFAARGGKLVHWHGEADANLFPAASAYYHERVRATMFPARAYADLNAFYRFFVVPGAGHCGANPDQPGPFPYRAAEQLIGWVEDGAAPDYLDGAGPGQGGDERICLWPGRPRWDADGTQECVVDEAAAGFVPALSARWKIAP